MCREPGGRVVGVPVLYCEPLKSSGHNYCTCFSFRCLSVWLRELRERHKRCADLREVRYARGVAVHGMVEKYSR